jgi:hypothetical protein
MKQIRGKIISVPCCHAKADTVADILGHGHLPRKGDISVCLQCGTALEIVDPSIPSFAVLDVTTLRPQEQQAIARVQAARHRTKPK